MPYILFKDACNKKSNQKNLGTIKSSNLCTEIIEYSDNTETAVCNLASIALSKFVKADKTFDYDSLHEVTKQVTVNLNKLIDVNYYPNDKTRRSNMLHRPIGIGVQGLADVFMKMNLAFVSDEAKEINKKIFETIYFASLEKSMELSKEREKDMQYLIEEYNFGNWTFKNDNDKVCRKYQIYNVTDASITVAIQNDNKIENLLNKYKPIPKEIKSTYQGSYSSFIDSPISKGLLQFDLWDDKQSDRYDWDKLRVYIQKYGIRNSLLVAPMPTASTSQILGNNECFEPYTSNIYSRRTLAGDFMIVNKYMIKELIDLELWNSDVKNNIIENRGSIQNILDIPSYVKEKYKPKLMVDLATLTGAIIVSLGSEYAGLFSNNEKLFKFSNQFIFP